jgi:hypothetical protein
MHGEFDEELLLGAEAMVSLPTSGNWEDQGLEREAWPLQVILQDRRRAACCTESDALQDGELQACDIARQFLALQLD